jgi:ABC-2 type transport system permease protein
MIRQTGYELYKMSRRPRSYTGFAAFLVANFLVMLGAKYGGFAELFAQHSAGATLEIVGSPLNAEFMAWLIVGSPLSVSILIMWLPFFVSLVLGETFAGEHIDGTLRTLLTRPVARGSVFAAKFVSSLVYTTALVAFLGLSAYAIGAIVFGAGGLLSTGTLMHPMLGWYAHGEAIARLGLAYSLTLMVALTAGMFAFFISIWLSNPLGAIGGGIMLQFSTFIMGEIGYFQPIRPYLFGAQMMVSQKAFLDPIPWGEIGASIACLGAYVIVLLIASAVIFRRKDILA